MIEERVGARSGRDGLTVADRNIDVLSIQAGRLAGHIDPQISLRLEFREPVHAGDEPFGGDRRGRRNAQRRPGLCLACALGGGGERRERIGCRLVEDFPCRREAQRTVGANEDGDPQLGLQFSDLVADGPGREPKFGGGAGEVQMARGGFEHLERASPGDGAGHGASTRARRSGLMNSQIPAAGSASKLPETKAPLHSPAPARAATMGWQTMPPTLPPVLRTPVAAALSVRAMCMVAAQYAPSLISMAPNAAASASTAA